MLFFLYLLGGIISISHFSVYALEKDSSFFLKNTFKNLYEYVPVRQEMAFDLFLNFLNNEQGKSELGYRKIFVNDKIETSPIRENLKKNQNSFLNFELDSSFFLKALFVFLFAFIFAFFRRKKSNKNFN